MFGDGEQTRSNTYVADCIQATLLASEHRAHTLGRTFNIGGGEVVSLNQVIAILEELTGKNLHIERLDPRPGDQKHTSAHIGRAKDVLGYQPMTSVRDGLQAQLEWQLSRM